MLKYTGQISKMLSTISDTIQYSLPIGNNTIELNQFINKKIQLQFEGQINCVECNSKIKKTFMQGYCYPCFLNSPKTSECIFKPHLCQAHEGISRDMKWSEQNCLTENIVYLSLTSNLKVGVTRYSQLPTRWIDQGAHHAIIFAKTPNRYLAGMIEVELSKFISDRTQWQRMIKGEFEFINLNQTKKKLETKLSKKYHEYITSDTKVLNLIFPIYSTMNKVKSINLHKTPEFKGVLTGIKGQYLIFDNMHVLNVRKYTGYSLNLCFNNE